jgi:two-component system, OmpR family, sensor histidine kinase SenX3
VTLLRRHRETVGAADRELERLRDEALSRLAASKAEVSQLRRALDALPIGVVLSDRTGRTVVENTVARAHHGHAAVLIEEAVERLVGQALAGRASEHSVEFIGPPLVVLAVRASPLEAGGALVTIDNVSERARLDTVRTDFVANISHELKTPVGALAVLAEALADNDDPATSRRLADKMVEEAHRAAHTIDDLLELSRTELGGTATRDVVSIAKVLDEAVSRAGAAAEQHSIAVSIDIPPDDLQVVGSHRQLVSAVSNLVENAIKYSDVGAEVVVRANEIDGWVELAVIDTGAGIPARDMDRIFERFYRVDRARHRQTGGTGLGLSIVRHVATNHAGAVTVQSREGEGSTFTLRLPMGSP